MLDKFLTRTNDLLHSSMPVSNCCCLVFFLTSKLCPPSCPRTLWQNKPTNMLMNNSNFSPVMYETGDAWETLVVPLGSTLCAADGTSIPTVRFSVTLIRRWWENKHPFHAVLMEVMKSDHTTVSTTRLSTNTVKKYGMLQKCSNICRNNTTFRIFRTFLNHKFDVLRWCETSLTVTLYVKQITTVKKKHYINLKKICYLIKLAKNCKETQFQSFFTKYNSGFTAATTSAHGQRFRLLS